MCEWVNKWIRTSLSKQASKQASKQTGKQASKQMHKQMSVWRNEGMEERGSALAPQLYLKKLKHGSTDFSVHVSLGLEQLLLQAHRLAQVHPRVTQQLVHLQRRLHRRAVPLQKRNEKKVYAVRRYNGSLCIQKQHRSTPTLMQLYLLAAHSHLFPVGQTWFERLWSAHMDRSDYMQQHEDQAGHVCLMECAHR